MQYMTRNVRGMLWKHGEVRESHWGCVIAKGASCRGKNTSKLKPGRWEGVEPKKKKKGKGEGEGAPSRSIAQSKHQKHLNKRIMLKRFWQLAMLNFTSGMTEEWFAVVTGSYVFLKDQCTTARLNTPGPARRKRISWGPELTLSDVISCCGNLINFLQQRSLSLQMNRLPEKCGVETRVAGK